MKKTFLYLAIAAIALTACGERKTIPKRKLVKILFEMHTVDAALEQSSSRLSGRQLDSTAVYTAILDKYGYTVAQFFNSMKVYGRSKKDADKLYSKVYDLLDKQQKQYAKEVEMLYAMQNRWTQKSSWNFPDDGDTSRLEFSIPVADSTGSYVLSADITLFPEDSVGSPRITMYLYAYHCRKDSVLVDSVRVDTMFCADTVFGQVEQPVLRDGSVQNCTLTIAGNGLATHVRGFILNRDNDSLALKPRHATVKNIMLRHVPEAGEDKPFQKLMKMSIEP